MSVPLVAAASAIGAAVAGTHATGTRASDVVLGAALGAGAALAASVARTWSWLVAAGLAAALADGWWQIAAGAALALALTAAVVEHLPARRLAGALIGAVAIQALLRLGPGPFFGSTALVAALAVAVLGASAWQMSRRSTRRALRYIAYGVGGLAGLIALSFGLSALQARSSLEVGVDRAQDGLAAVRAGDTARAADLLEEASRSFGAARGDLHSWWARPARVLPGMGPQQVALDRLAAAGADVAGTAATEVSVADVQSLRLVDGQIDLAKVTAMQRPLASVLTALRRADAAARSSRSPWLLAPLAHRQAAFQTSVTRAIGDSETAALAVRVLPGLLGQDGPRQYFVAFATPSETRDLGGFMGAYGVIVADHGRLSLPTTGLPTELNRAGQGRTLTNADQLPARYRELHPEQFWQNVTGTADFPTVAETVQQMWPQSGGGPLDGVLYVDPDALGAMLTLTGPVAVEGRARPLSASDAAPFLLLEQYREFGESSARHDFLLDAARAVFDRLTTGRLAGPAKVADAVGPATRGGHLVLHSFHADEQVLFQRLGADGAVPAVGSGDYLSVRSSNTGTNKIDALLHRSIDYRPTVDPSTGRVDAVLTVTLENQAPSTGLPGIVIANTDGLPPGSNRTVLTVLTPFSLDDATVDGQPLAIGATTEFARHAYAALVELAPQSRAVVRLRLHGQVVPGRAYRLRLQPQPTANPDLVRVAVRAPAGWAGGGGVAEQDFNRSITVDSAFRRD